MTTPAIYQPRALTMLAWIGIMVLLATALKECSADAPAIAYPQTGLSLEPSRFLSREAALLSGFSLPDQSRFTDVGTRLLPAACAEQGGEPLPINNNSLFAAAGTFVS